MVGSENKLKVGIIGLGKDSSIGFDLLDKLFLCDSWISEIRVSNSNKEIANEVKNFLISSEDKLAIKYNAESLYDKNGEIIISDEMKNMDIVVIAAGFHNIDRFKSLEANLMFAYKIGEKFKGSKTKRLHIENIVEFCVAADLVGSGSSYRDVIGYGQLDLLRSLLKIEEKAKDITDYSKPVSLDIIGYHTFVFEYEMINILAKFFAKKKEINSLTREIERLNKHVSTEKIESLEQMIRNLSTEYEALKKEKEKKEKEYLERIKKGDIKLVALPTKNFLFTTRIYETIDTSKSNYMDPERILFDINVSQGIISFEHAFLMGKYAPSTNKQTVNGIIDFLKYFHDSVYEDKKKQQKYFHMAMMYVDRDISFCACQPITVVNRAFVPRYTDFSEKGLEGIFDEPYREYFKKSILLFWKESIEKLKKGEMCDIKGQLLKEVPFSGRSSFLSNEEQDKIYPPLKIDLSKDKFYVKKPSALLVLYDGSLYGFYEESETEFRLEKIIDESKLSNKYPQIFYDSCYVLLYNVSIGSKLSLFEFKGDYLSESTQPKNLPYDISPVKILQYNDKPILLYVQYEQSSLKNNMLCVLDYDDIINKGVDLTNSKIIEEPNIIRDAEIVPYSNKKILCYITPKNFGFIEINQGYKLQPFKTEKICYSSNVNPVFWGGKILTLRREKVDSGKYGYLLYSGEKKICLCSVFGILNNDYALIIDNNNKECNLLDKDGKLEKVSWPQHWSQQQSQNDIYKMYVFYDNIVLVDKGMFRVYSLNSLINNKNFSEKKNKGYISQNQKLLSLGAIL